MLGWILGLFLIAHGWAHIWPVAVSQGWARIQDAGWTGESWLLSWMPSGSLVLLSTLGYSISLAGFAVSGVLLLLGQGWGKTLILPSAILSSLTILLFWDGRLTAILEKGLIGLLINLALIIYLALSGPGLTLT